MEKWRQRSFPVGIYETVLPGDDVDYPLTVYYPALSNGKGAVPDERHAPYPGLVFAHGYMANASAYTHMGNLLGSHGYVTALFTASEQTGNPLALLRKMMYRAALGGGEVHPPSTTQPLKAIQRERDAITKTITYLSTDPMGIVQTDALGIVGHSLGGMTSLQEAAQDTRLHAIVACSAVNIKMIVDTLLRGMGSTIAEQMMGNSTFATGIKIPSLFIHGMNDQLTPFEHGLSYYHMITNTPKEALAIHGSTKPMNRLRLKPHILGLAMSPDEYTPLVSKYIVNWFNFFLYGDQDCWPYLFGNHIRDDLHRGLLSRLEMNDYPPADGNSRARNDAR